MTINPQTPTLGRNPITLSTSPLNGMKNFWVKFKAGTDNAFRIFQTARMISTLANLTDTQLKQIGIERSDIPQYAEDLIASQ